MPKGYIIARVTVSDPEEYAKYAKGSTEAMARYGGTPLVRGGRMETLEGESRPRNVVIEFESFEKARAYYLSPEYQAAKAFRENAGVGDFIVIEGV